METEVIPVSYVSVGFSCDGMRPEAMRQDPTRKGSVVNVNPTNTRPQSDTPEIRKYKKRFNSEILCAALWGRCLWAIRMLLFLFSRVDRSFGEVQLGMSRGFGERCSWVRWKTLDNPCSRCPMESCRHTDLPLFQPSCAGQSDSSPSPRIKKERKMRKAFDLAHIYRENEEICQIAFL